MPLSYRAYLCLSLISHHKKHKQSSSIVIFLLSENVHVPQSVWPPVLKTTNHTHLSFSVVAMDISSNNNSDNNNNSSNNNNSNISLSRLAGSKTEAGRKEVGESGPGVITCAGAGASLFLVDPLE